MSSDEESCANQTAGRGERGGTRLTFLIVVALLVGGGYFAYNYIPVAYSGAKYKEEMQRAVDQAAAMGRGVDWINSEITKAGQLNDVPAGAEVRVDKLGQGGYRATAKYTHPINLVFFNYNYNFEESVTSSSFLVQ